MSLLDGLASSTRSLVRQVLYSTGSLQDTKNKQVEGFVADGYEPVRELFENNFKAGLEVSSQICVYVGNEKVVDLWGTTDKRSQFGPDDLIPIFSSSKSLTSIVIALLVDKGHLNYDDKISDIWPEFAQNGKTGGRVADLMRHELGLPAFNKPIQEKDLLPMNIKENSIGKLIEEQVFEFEPGTRRDYHFFTRGWIANEIVRRVDPKGRTIGEILRDSISDPLGAKAFIGLTESELQKTATLQYLSPASVLLNNFLPEKEKKTGISIFSLALGALGVWFSGEDLPPPAIEGIPIYRVDLLTKFFNSNLGRSGEIPSANANCSARGLAVIGACMANKGTLNGVKILSKKGCASLYDKACDAKMFGQMPTKFTQAGLNIYKDPELRQDNEESMGRDGFVGWMGFGGSVFQWHPELQMSFAYVPTLLDWTDLVNGKALKLQRIVVQCVKKKKVKK